MKYLALVLLLVGCKQISNGYYYEGKLKAGEKVEVIGSGFFSGCSGYIKVPVRYYQDLDEGAKYEAILQKCNGTEMKELSVTGFEKEFSHLVDEL